jgi:hypothetical protein
LPIALFPQVVYLKGTVSAKGLSMYRIEIISSMLKITTDNFSLIEKLKGELKSVDTAIDKNGFCVAHILPGPGERFVFDTQDEFEE